MPKAFHEPLAGCVCDDGRILRLQSVHVRFPGSASRGTCARDPGDGRAGVSVLRARPGAVPGSAAQRSRSAGPAVRARGPSCVGNVCSSRAGYLCPSSQECAACASGFPGRRSGGGWPCEGRGSPGLAGAGPVRAEAGAGGGGRGGAAVRKGRRARRRQQLGGGGIGERSAQPGAALAFPSPRARAPFRVRNQKPSAAPGAGPAPAPLPGPRPRPPRDDRDRSPPARPLAPAGLRPQCPW